VARREGGNCRTGKEVELWKAGFEKAETRLLAPPRCGSGAGLVWFARARPGRAAWGTTGKPGRERSTGRRQLDKQNTGGVAGLRGRRPDPTRPDLRPKFQGGAGGFSHPKYCCCPCREGEELVN
jgi:hypothetical protein